ncbi:MAG: ATP-binding cassette domain-containing protein, partial [Proteobacteria bacterium]|nr:ATP-binding cassette domain-containing protein [Pseudomonadota bacterium]
QIAPGVMIVAALLVGKFLQPIQQAVAGWKGLVEARAQYDRINNFLSQFPPDAAKMPLPELKGFVHCNNVTVIPPGGKKPTLAEVSLDFVPGSVTVVLGPSGAGKSTLIRALLGLWPYVQGEIRFDGAEVRSYERESFGSQIGYLPQSIELFEGSIAENIARFRDLDAEKVYRAAEDAGVKDLILSLPEGFNTKISGHQGLLSPGQRQRIALARAIYNRPKILVLDEPNSNLDSAGDEALSGAIQMMRDQGSTVIVVSHRPNILPLADNVVVINTGRVQASGPRDQVIAKLQAVVPSALSSGEQEAGLQAAAN